jgi:hypothetical protein
MRYAAEQARVKLASKSTGADASSGRDQGRTTGGGASAVVVVHERGAAALTGCRDPRTGVFACKDVQTLKVGPQSQLASSGHSSPSQYLQVLKSHN